MRFSEETHASENSRNPYLLKALQSGQEEISIGKKEGGDEYNNPRISAQFWNKFEPISLNQASKMSARGTEKKNRAVVSFCRKP